MCLHVPLCRRYRVRRACVWSILALLLLPLGAVWSGCSVVESDAESTLVDRTLPQALDAQRVSLGEARHTGATPDTVNVAAYVVKIEICPEGWNCLLPDGIVVAETPDPGRSGDTRRLFVRSPRQFVEGRRYLMSLEVAGPPAQNRDENTLDLIGYSRLESSRPESPEPCGLSGS